MASFDGEDVSSVGLYGIEDSPPFGEAIPHRIQHILAMFLGNVAPRALGDG